MTDKRPTVSELRKAAVLLSDPYFAKRVVIMDTGCWTWCGQRNTKGYGRISRGRAGPVVREGASSAMAHRVVWEKYRGPIPTNLTIDHLCRNPACVNPWHMEIVSRYENSIIRGNGPTAVNRRKATCRKGHSEWGVRGGFNVGNRFCRPCDRERCRTNRAALRGGESK